MAAVDKLLGDIVSCPGCGQQVHALCTQRANCFRCVCRVCNSPPGDAMRPCKSCRHRVHVTCIVQVPYRLEVTCKVCAPKPRLSPRPRKKQVKHRFNPQWKVGRPWLHFENGVMSCLACRAYPQMGLQKVWLDGTPQVRKRAVVAHGNSGVHAVAMALSESGGASATVIGGLPLVVREAIFGLFHLVYRLVKRYGCFSQLAADAETATLVGGQVAPAYRSEWAARATAHVIARLIRAAGGELVRHSAFFALASDSSTDRAANKQELVYTRTMRAGRSHTAFLGLQDQGMTACAYCVTVSLCHCVTVPLCHRSHVHCHCAPPPPHRVMCLNIHETVTAPCVHTCITWSLCHCVPLQCP